ncbi:Gag-pol Polyprotein, partial [Phytophthora megakarya]
MIGALQFLVISEPKERLQVSAYSDADHANCPDTSRPVTGNVLKLNGYSFGFKSKMQPSVTDDTCKSELVAASMCVEDLLWAQKLLKELKLDAKAGKLHIDNQSTIKVCTDAGNFDGVRRYAKKSRKIAEV